MTDKFFAINVATAAHGDIVVVAKKPDGQWIVRDIDARDVDMKGGPS